MKAAQLWALSAWFCTTPAFALGESCWHGDFDEERCCVQGDPACWDDVYTRSRCCSGNQTRRVRGDPSCWIDGYSFEECCIENPKEGCWDASFGPDRCCVDKELDVLELSAMLNPLELDYTEAFARIMASVDDKDCGDHEFWFEVKKSSAALNLSHIYGQVGQSPSTETMEFMTRRALRWRQDRTVWDRDSAECPEGAIAVIDLIVAEIDRDVEEDVARSLFRLRMELAAQRPFAQAAGTLTWRTQDLVIEHVPKLYGLEGHHSCHQSKLKIYMYQIPKYAHMVKPLLKCSQKMSFCSASVHIHRWLQSGSCLTKDPDEADLFYFPAYESCYNETSCLSTDATERCFAPDFDPAELPYFQRKMGQDHVFVFGCNLLPLLDFFSIRTRNSIIMTVESFQAVNVAGPNMLAWLVFSKDVLIPGYIPAWRVSAMEAFNRPVIQRSILATFHGHSRKSEKVGHMYRRSLMAEVRDRIIDYFANNTCCSAGPPVRDYFRRSGLSRFCLIPAGLTAWTIHLYEAFFFGCVPVILSDDLTVPFQDVIDWPSVSMKVPTNISMEDLHAKLKAVSTGTLKRMHRKLASYRCWFDYNRGWGKEGDSETECSPYNGMMRGLAKRVAAIKASSQQLPTYWEPQAAD